ncbi:hypothetical protein BsWGS_05276 [Bradybaena similaris]
MDTKKLSSCWLLTFFAFLQCAVQAKGGFIFTMPNILRYGSTSEFCLTLHGDNQSQNVTMALVKEGTHAVEVHSTFPIGKHKCRKFQVPKPDDYTLVLSSENGVMHNQTTISVFGEKLLTLVQTDKPVYKPGQKVKFRVLTLMSNLKPRIGKIKSIFVIDPNDLRVKQYLDVETKGISSLEFQLAAEAKLGRWKIEILVADADDHNKQFTFGDFEVKEYVLPRFEVEITPPSYILANQKSVEAKVCAKYTYGKNVTGFLDVDVCWTSYYGPPEPCIKEVAKISGCHIFSINVSDIIGRSHHYHVYELLIKASVTEQGTGVMVNGSKNGPSWTQIPLKIELDDNTNGFFKPGLPYYGQATVTKLDGTPAEGESITITASDMSNNLKFSKTFITDRDGIVEFSLCHSFTEKSQRISIDAVAEKYSSIEELNTPRGYKVIKQWFSPSLSYIQIPRINLSDLKCGKRLTLNIPFTTRVNTDIEFNYQVMTRGKVITTGQISYNQSKSYPGKDQILPPSNICLHDSQPATESPTTADNPSNGSDETSTPAQQTDGENVIPNETLHSSHRQARSIFHEMDDTFFEEREFVEPIIRSENVSNVVANFLLDVPIKPLMSPKFTLLVYYIKSDGEVVADSMEFQVNPCFENEVEMEFNKSVVLPGENVDINLTASPGSVCAIGVVDKSVNILGGKHQITSEQVFKKIEEFSTGLFDDVSIPYQRDDYCERRVRKLGVTEEIHYTTYTSPFVDAMQAFKSSGFLVLSNLNLETRPCTAESTIMYDSFQPEFMVPGPPPVNAISSIPLPPQTSSVRSNFPETWLWDLHVVGDTGETILKETAPHTITEWVGNAMCLEQEKGFGISKMTSLTTFQPFFLSLHLPFAAVRGERLPIMFTVYNYLEKCLHIQLTLDLDTNFEIHNDKQHQDPVCICGGKSHTAKFYATPNEIGRLPVFAKAEIIPGLCGNTIDVDTTYVGLTDSVKRQIFVKAEGVEQEYTHTSYICSKDGSKEETVILPLPAEGEMVKDSARGEVKVIGDIMGPVLTNLNNLVRMPTGCGEQNMIGFVPNIFVLKYLTSIGKVTKDIQDNAVKYMEIGYQRELTFRHKDGSYSAFGENDPKGSVWLTAFVVKSFAQARPFIYIDEKDLTLSLKFLRFNQLETGCFRETGKVLGSYMMGGLGSDKEQESNTALTAYVLIALLTANVNTSEPVIVGGMSCVNSDFQEKKEKMDPYTLALVAYANSLHQSNSKIGHEILSVLESKAKRNGTLKYWSRETVKPKPVNTWFYYAAPSAEVEMTSYALMAYLKLFGERGIENSHNIAMWLSQQRNPNGGFSSTQDTVVGLEALSEFASLAYNKDGTELKISVTGKQMDESFSVSENEHTTLLLQSVPIRTLPNVISITANGVGCALVQSSVHYNKQPKDLQGDEKPSFHLRVKAKKYVHNIDKCDRRTISVSVGKRGSQGFDDGMSLLTIKMVTGWAPVQDSLTKLESLFPVLGIKKKEYSEEQGLTLYFEQLPNKPQEFSIDIEQDRDLAITSPKPAEVKIFQYYETDVSAVQSYELKNTCGTKAEIPRNPSVADSQNPLLQTRIKPDRPSRINLRDQNRIDLSLIPAEGNSDGVCPVCIPIKHVPENLKQLVCNSTAVYKVIAGRKGIKPLKIIQNLRAEKKEKLNTFSNYTLPTGCDCTVLEPPVKRVLMLVPDTVSADHIINLKSRSMVLLADKKIEKQVRKLRKSCSLQNRQL